LDLAGDVSEGASEVAVVVAIDVEYAAGGKEAAGKVGRGGVVWERVVYVVGGWGRVPEHRSNRVVLWGGGVSVRLVSEVGDGFVKRDRWGVPGELFQPAFQVANG